jgi:hypothetical protein
MFKLLGTLATSAAALTIEDLAPPSVEIQDLPQVDPKDFVESWQKAPIDHFNFQDERTYNQRYFMNDKYFDKENGPIFLYICGEYTCSIRDDRLFPFMIGAQHKALMFAVEHRFYGKSQPFDTWETKNFEYLNSEQALADLAHFLNIQLQDKPDRKVIVIGGSYPGALSAWFREKYPHLTTASWASSGVVHPIEDFKAFDGQVFADLNNTSEECWKSVLITQLEIEDIITGKDDSKLRNRGDIMTKLGADPSMDNGDFAFYLADIFVESVQYGSRSNLCKVGTSMINMT